MSLGIHRRYDFDDWASANGRLAPWSDDQTTSHYQSPLPRRGATLRVVAPPAAAEPVLDARAAQRRLGNGYYQPPARVPVQRTAAAPSVVPKLEPPPASAELEANPFARPSVLGPLAALSVASLALFAAVFLTRVLMAALTTAPVAPAAAPPAPAVAAAAPSAEPTAPPTAASPAAAAVAGAENPTERPAASAPRRHTASRSRSEAHEETTATAATTEAPDEPTSRSSDEAPARTPDAAPATLRINSLPWSQVYLDGRLLGNTPLRGVSVPPGTHTLRLVNPEFGMVKTRPVTAAAGEVVTLVEMLDE